MEAAQEPWTERMTMRFHIQNDGRMIAHVKTDKGRKATFVHPKYQGIVKAGEAWEIGLKHDFRVCFAYPLNRLPENTVTQSDLLNQEHREQEERLHRQHEAAIDAAAQRGREKATASTVEHIVSDLNRMWGSAKTASALHDERSAGERMAPQQQSMPTTQMKPVSRETIERLEAERPKFQRYEPQIKGFQLPVNLPPLESFVFVKESTVCSSCKHHFAHCYKSGSFRICGTCFAAIGGERDQRTREGAIRADRRDT